MRLGLRFLAFLAASSLGLSLSAQAPPAETVDVLVCRYFDAPTDNARAAVLKTIKQRQDITIAHVEDAVRRGVFYKPQQSGTSTRTITVEFDGSKTACTFWIPPSYDHEKSYPALLIMHGTGGTGKGFLSRWLPYVRNRNMIIIAPTQVTGVDKTDRKRFGKGHGYGTHEIERSVPISAINAARRVYNIDSDRITITGVSMGGHAAWDSVLTRTDYFAGAIPEAGIPFVEGFQIAKYLFLPNLFQARMWVAQGTPDKDQPKINTEATDQLRRMGYAVEYRQYEARRHGSYRGDSDKALDFVLAGKRDVYAGRVVKIAHRLAHGRACWVRIDKIKGSEWNPRKRITLKVDAPVSKAEMLKRAQKKVKKQLARVDAKVLPDNVLSIRTRKVARLTVFLHDKLVDMSKPITIRVNGQTRYRKRRFRRDVGFMLEEVRREYDTGRIFHNHVSLRVY